MVEPVEWDQPLPDNFHSKFISWKETLTSLEGVDIPRTYSFPASTKGYPIDLFVFSDASEKAIAAVTYLRTVDKDGRSNLGFVMGKAKVAPKHGQGWNYVLLSWVQKSTRRLRRNFELNRVTFFTDRKVVLGYINNETKRFYIYVRNRVDRIRQLTKPNQWNYVPTNLNPADDATSSIPAGNLQNSLWVNGPPSNFIEQRDQGTFPLVSPDNEQEIRSMKTPVDTSRKFDSHYFMKFSTWKNLKRALRALEDLARSHSLSDKHTHVSDMESENFIIKTLQEKVYPEEISLLRSGLPLPRQSNLLTFSPYLDNLGLLRIGGRLRNASLNMEQMNPVLIPKHHVSNLIIPHYHEKIHHQGRQITEGAIRSAGFWLIGAKRLIASFIHYCVKCRKLRGCLGEQKMADLPAERLEFVPPFSYIGIDVFGPWTISTRKTLGGEVNSK